MFLHPSLRRPLFFPCVLSPLTFLSALVWLWQQMTYNTTLYYTWVDFAHFRIFVISFQMLSASDSLLSFSETFSLAFQLESKISWTSLRWVFFFFFFFSQRHLSSPLLPPSSPLWGVNYRANLLFCFLNGRPHGGKGWDVVTVITHQPANRSAMETLAQPGLTRPPPSPLSFRDFSLHS